MSQEVHFDIPIDGSDRAERFYSGVFGWSFKKAPVPNMEYWVIRSAEGDALGGLVQRSAPEQTIINYYTVDSIDAALDKVTALGGSVVVGKTPIPHVGYNAQCIDSEGNSLGLWENDKEAR